MKTVEVTTAGVTVTIWNEEQSALLIVIAGWALVPVTARAQLSWKGVSIAPWRRQEKELSLQHCTGHG